MMKMLETLIMSQGQPMYNVWMHQSNEAIQSLALAFGERFYLESAIEGLAKANKSK